MDRTQNISFDPSKLSKAEAEQYSSSDGDSDENEDFQIPSTDPGADEFLDQNPRKRRRTGRDAKESAALGIFGSESEDDGPSSWKHKNFRRKVNFFPSSSNNNKKDDEDDEDDSADMPQAGGNEHIEYGGMGSMRARSSGEEDEEDEDDEPAAGLGLGFAAQRVAQDTSWSAGSRPAQRFSKQASKGTGVNARAPLGPGFVPSSSYVPELKVQVEDDPPPQVSHPSAFAATKSGKRGNGGSGKPNPNSFAARMMAKMGYKEGTGLGKESQGRNIIIEANLRPQRAGLGVVKEKTESERQEEKRQARLRGEVVVDSDEEEKKRKAARKKKALAGGSASTPGSGTSTPKRQKAKYLTLDEARKAAPGLNIPDAFTPILDMTGPGRKMLTTSSGLMTPTGASATTTETPEQAESRKLARRAQTQFMAILEEWQGLQERKAYAELKLQQEKQELDDLEHGLAAYRSIVDQFGRIAIFSDDHVDAQLRWSQLISQLKAASDSIGELSRASLAAELTAVAVSALHPAFKAVLQTWDPLKDPGATLAADLASISSLLGIQTVADQTSTQVGYDNRRRKHIATPYEAMMYKLWLPHVARAVREWNVRESDQLLSLFDSWKPLLPPFVRSQLLQQDIVRKLDEAIAKWEPKRRKHHTLPHIWLFPWLQHMSPENLDPRSSTGLVADVKRKFRQLIDVWEFDRGVVPGLIKWKEVLRPSRKDDQWRPLVMSHVLPSMARYLRKKFEVDPSDQAPYMPMLTGVFAWLEIVSPSALAEVLVSEVFPKWHERLHQWLTMDSVDYVQVSEWLDWWREGVFPSDLKDNASIAAELGKGERAIEMALELGDRARDQLPPPERGPALATGPRKKSPPSQVHTPLRQPAAPALGTHQQQPASFRQQVEDWCQTHDLQFIPERTKVHAKGPLYRITARGDGKGGLLAYFEDGTLRFDSKGGGGHQQTVTVRTEEDFFVKMVHPGLVG